MGEMRRLVITLLATLTSLLALTQQLPRFTYNDFEGWTYNNPNVELSTDNITYFKVRLYVNSEGLVLALSSPDFSCQGIDSIRADVKWKSSSMAVALTMALDDQQGTPLDSTTCYPTSSTSNVQSLSFSLPVPAGVTTAHVRFVSWEANKDNCGAVREVVLTAITSGAHETIPGDVTGDGNVNVSDVAALISLLLTDNTEGNPAADVDGDSHVSIGDVAVLIQMLLTVK